jgi:hypothetical protein
MSMAKTIHFNMANVITIFKKLKGAKSLAPFEYRNFLNLQYFNFQNQK